MLFSNILLISCSNGIIGKDYQENLKELDKTYGYCDNPQRGLNKSSIQYKICKDRERASGSDGLTDEDFKLPFVDGFFNNSSNNVVYTNTVNPYLWNGSLNILSNYPLILADSNGGYIETNWIYQEGLENQRCVIKVQITSKELLSNAVNTKILCQKKNGDNWVTSDDKFLEEEKQLNLAILSSARDYYQEDNNKK